MPLALHVFEPRYRQLIADLLDSEDPQPPEFGVVLLRQGWEVGRLGDLHPVGTSAQVSDVLPLPDGRCDLSATGDRRFRIEQLHPEEKAYLVASVSWLPEPDGELSDTALPATRAVIVDYLDALRQLRVHLDEPELDLAESDPRAMSYLVARLASLPAADRQILLAEPDTAGRLRRCRAILRRETELIRQLHAIPVSAQAFQPGPAD